MKDKPNNNKTEHLKTFSKLYKMSHLYFAAHGLYTNKHFHFPHASFFGYISSKVFPIRSEE